MLSQRPSSTTTKPRPVGQASLQGTEEIMLQKLLKVSDRARLATYLCINKNALITALNNPEKVIKGRLTNDDIVLIAGSKLENCQLLAKSSLYSTLDSSTKQTIDVLLRNQERIKSHMAHDKQNAPLACPLSNQVLSSSP